MAALGLEMSDIAQDPSLAIQHISSLHLPGIQKTNIIKYYNHTMTIQ